MYFTIVKNIQQEGVFDKNISKQKMPQQKGVYLQKLQIKMAQKQEQKSEEKTRQIEQSYIGHYEDAPHYMRDNAHITHGYRINFDSPKKIFKSLFMVHNESVNIWTHLCPALLILIVIFYLSFSLSLLPAADSLKFSNHSLTEGFASYSHALDNLTLIKSMKEFSESTSREIEEIRQSALVSYSAFAEEAEKWKKGMSEAMEGYRSTMTEEWKRKVQQLDELKKGFENVFIPFVLHSINDNINSTYIESLKKQLETMKAEIDSERYSFLQGRNFQTPNPDAITRWPIVIFLASALTCLMCSAMFHLFYPMSGSAYRVFSRLDYAGINILMAGSSFPPLYYSFYCNFHVAAFYLVFIVSGALTLFIVSLLDFLHRPENKTIKALCFGGFGVALGIPLFHIALNEVIFDNYGDPFRISGSLPFHLVSGFAYLFGLYIYTVRCPERGRPGKFNVCGHSHQIWHCFVVMGIIFSYMAVMDNFQMRKINSSCPISS